MLEKCLRVINRAIRFTGFIEFFAFAPNAFLEALADCAKGTHSIVTGTFVGGTGSPC